MRKRTPSPTITASRREPFLICWGSTLRCSCPSCCKATTSTCCCTAASPVTDMAEKLQGIFKWQAARHCHVAFRQSWHQSQQVLLKQCFVNLLSMPPAYWQLLTVLQYRFSDSSLQPLYTCMTQQFPECLATINLINQNLNCISKHTARSMCNLSSD